MRCRLGPVPGLVYTFRKGVCVVSVPREQSRIGHRLFARRGPRHGQVKRVPRVRIVRPGGRPYQLRYAVDGRQVRVSTGTRGSAEAERQRQELQARLTLGLAVQKPARVTGPGMPWAEFRKAYSELQLVTLRDKTAIDAESRLDIATRKSTPKTLG